MSNFFKGTILLAATAFISERISVMKLNEQHVDLGKVIY